MQSKSWSAAHCRALLPPLLLQLSMDRVHVYPDGELNIQAVVTSSQGASSRAAAAATQQRSSQPGSPSHMRSTQSPQKAHAQASAGGPPAGSSTGGADPRLRVAVGRYSTAGSPGGSLTGSPTRLAAAGVSAAFCSPKAAGASPSLPLRQQRPVSAAAAAAAAVVGSRLHGSLSVSAQPGMTPSTDSMLRALSNLTPGQVQHLAAAGQQR